MTPVRSTSVNLVPSPPAGNPVDFGTLVIKGVTYKVTVTSATPSNLQDKEAQAVALQAIKLLVENALTSVTGQIEHIDLTESGLTIKEKDNNEQHVNYNDTALSPVQHESFTSIYQEKFNQTLTRKTTQNVANELFRNILSGTLTHQAPATASPQPHPHRAHGAYAPTSKALAPLSAHLQSRRRTRSLSPSLAASSPARGRTRRGIPAPLLETPLRPLILPRTPSRSGFTQPRPSSSAGSSAAHHLLPLHTAADAAFRGSGSPHSPIAAPPGEGFRMPHTATDISRTVRWDSQPCTTRLRRDNPHLEILEEGPLPQAAAAARTVSSAEGILSGKQGRGRTGAEGVRFPSPKTEESAVADSPQTPLVDPIDGPTTLRTASAVPSALTPPHAGAPTSTTQEQKGSRQPSRRIAPPTLDDASKRQLVQALIAATR